MKDQSPIRYQSFDVLKGFACIAVVLLHGSFPAWLSNGRAALRFAVPIFFFISGFFAVSGGMNERSMVRKAKHILVLLLKSGAFYFLFTLVFTPLISPSQSIYTLAVETITTEKIAKFILTCDPLLYSHLWFLIALFLCYFTMLFLGEFLLRHRLCFPVALVLLTLYSAMQEFRLIPTSIQLADMQGRIYIYNSYIFRAMPFFLMGVSAKPYTTKIQGLSIPKPLIGGLVVFGTLLAIAERCRYGEVQFYIGSYIVVASLLIYAIKSPAMSNPFWEHIGRDLSMHIYILHIAVGKAMDLFGKYAGFGGGPFGLRFACSLPLL